MTCPGCGSESREGAEAAHGPCGLDLVESLPPEPDLSLVKVYATGNEAIIPVYESLLNDAGIEYMPGENRLRPFRLAQIRFEAQLRHRSCRILCAGGCGG